MATAPGRKNPLIASQPSAPGRHLDLSRDMAMVGQVMGRVLQYRLVQFARRMLALGLAVVVFALGLYAASPVLHGHLHPHDYSVRHDRCAVDLFANGVAVPLAVTAPLPSVNEWMERIATAPADVWVDSPRYLLQPERGPPVI